MLAQLFTQEMVDFAKFVGLLIALTWAYEKLFLPYENRQEEPPSRKQVTTQRRAAASVKVLRTKNSPNVVQPRRRALWQERNWRPKPEDANVLVGAFHTRFSGKPGYIVLKGGDAGPNEPSFYIKDPPEALLKSGHGACFRVRNNGWHWVHFNTSKVSVDAGIVAVEKQLAEFTPQK